MPITPVAEIPTVSLLYRLEKLVLPTADPDAAAPKPSRSLNDRIGLIQGDITKLEVDAIVNAANTSLLGGGGVDGAIHRAAGPGLIQECRKLRGCETGSAKITSAYNLPCQKVIHAVGPIYSSEHVDECEEDLAGCYTTSLELAAENGCKSIAFSALSTGIYGYPSHDAAPVAIRAVKDFLESADGEKLEKVIFCTFAPKDGDAYNEWLPHFFPPAEPEDAEDEGWEDVTGEKSADNGAPEIQKEISKEVTEEGTRTSEVHGATKRAEPKIIQGRIELPDVPTREPEDGPAPKKQKSGD